MSEKIIKNWISLAKYDLETAEAMLNAGRYLYVAFMCQQAIEKILKACYVKEFNDTPPYTHNLLRLAKELSFFSKIGSDKLEHVEVLNAYYIESRYTEELGELLAVLTEEKAREILDSTKGLFEWLKYQI
ncbi:MAG: HEPN domain-containing protein [Planctomycetes bacterium]|nr:HEPN domain-containing protein [Planctomycetota bacterium]